MESNKFFFSWLKWVTKSDLLDLWISSSGSSQRVEDAPTFSIATRGNDATWQGASGGKEVELDTTKGSMEVIYLPRWLVDFYGRLVGIYLYIPYMGMIYL